MQVSDLPVHHKIIKRLTDKSISTLTEIQQRSLLPAVQGKDIIASSKTGSGKTFAFLIPAINRLLTTKALSKQDPRVLIIAPTRELAKQVFLEAKSLVTGLNLTVSLIVGGENYNDQTKVLRRNPHIIVGTAGRIADHLKDKSFFINGLELLVFDEADRMMDLGFAEQLKMINAFADHRKRQTMLFSATLDNIELNHMAQSLLKAPVRIAVGESHEAHQDISQHCFFADHVSHKDALLKIILETNQYNQAVIFTATREDTDRISAWLNEQNFDAVGLRGDLPQNQRAQVMSGFSRGQQTILVTTDVASRGLDLLKVGMVVNFDMPHQADEYIHRIGRTGRAGQKGIAISLVGPRDWRNYQQVVNAISYELICENHPDSPATFSGKTAKPKSDEARQKKSDASQRKTGHSDGAAAKSRVDTMQGEDAGHMPVKKKPRQRLIQDDDSEE